MKMALAVAGVGMVTALGGTARETIAALGRGERHVAQTWLVDLGGDRIVGSFVLPVRAEHEGAARAVELAFPALVECIEAARPVRGASALFLCVPLSWGSFAAEFAPLIAPRREEWPAVVGALAAELEARGLRVPPPLRFVLARGHAAGVLALEQAAALFGRGEAAQAWIVGLDTHGERATLERLALMGALRSRRARGGFVAGEAAAVLCVRPAGDDAAGVAVQGLGVANESDTPSTARALTSAVSRSIEAWGGKAASIATVAIDLNGERTRAKEWSFAATRTLWLERAAPVLIHPAGQLGDVGAATVPLLVGLLASGHKRPGPALAIASSMDGLRGGVVMESQPAT
jgi:3-oxoacyl-[acyl-carrier-protein] synthase I